MWPLALALVALGVGPLLWTAGRRSQPLLELLDGFALVAIGGLVLGHTLPDAYRHAGWPVLLATLAGLMLPTLLERWLHREAAAATHGATLLLAIAGVALHAALDGAALARHQVHLEVAVVLHRLPVGLTIWMLLRPARPRLAVGTLLGLGVSTTIGYAAGGALLGISPEALGLFEGLVAGALLHVVLHAPHHPERRSGWRVGAGLGALFAVGLLYFVAYRYPGGHALEHAQQAAAAAQEGHGVLATFLELARESAAPLLLAYLGASLLHAFLPRATVGWMRRGPQVVQALRGMAFGLPLPICSCGVVPLYRGLIERGAPAAAALAFLVATPEIGIDAVLLSLPLLGAELTVARLVAAALVALIAGWVIGALIGGPRRRELTDDDGPPAKVATRIYAGFRAGFFGLVDNTAGWILLGLGIAAVGAQLLDANALARLPRGSDVVALTLLGIPTYVCASGATPLVAMLVAKGLSPGAALAFLLTGPATNITTFGVLADLHGRRQALSFGLLVGGLAIAIGTSVNAVLPDLARAIPLARHQAGQASSTGGWLGWAALCTLGLLYVASILRQGPRGFVAHVFKGATHGYDNEHGHAHSDHDHDHAPSRVDRRDPPEGSGCGCH